MKKFWISILALIYLATSVGATVYTHFCMDKMVDWGIGNGHTSNKTCPYCGMESSTAADHRELGNKKCCKNEQQQVKLDNDQKITETSFQFIPVIAATVPPAFYEYAFEKIPSIAEIFPLTNAPPPPDRDLLALNCFFRI